MSTTLQQQRYRNRFRPQHIPGRGAYSNAVYRRETREPEPSQNSSVQGIYNDARTVMVLCSFMGTQTTVKTRNGSTYKGHTIGFSEKGDIAMSDARLDNDEYTNNPNISGIIIPKDKFVVCKTNGVDLKGLCSSSADFTDSGITNRINGTSDAAMKELQPWHDDDAPDINSTLSLDDPSDGWDSVSMFKANRDKFNLQTTYNEDLHEYTTRLPDPHSEGYEEKEKFAKRQAEAIEQNEAYQSRIAKELADGDEESLYSAVQRGNKSSAAQPSRYQDSNPSIGKNSYTSPTQKEDSEQSQRTDSFRAQGRGLAQSASHSQHSLHQNMHQNARQMNNQFQGPPPSGGPLTRNQGPSNLHLRQQGQQNHVAPPHPHHQQQHPPQQYQQQPPPPHAGMQQHIPPISQRHQQQRPSPHQQLVSPSHQSSKPHPPHLHPQNVPSALSSSSVPHHVQHTLPPPHKLNPNHKQPSIQQQPSTQQPPPIQQSLNNKGTNVNGLMGPPASTPELSQPISSQSSAEFKNGAEIINQKTSQMDNQQVYHQKSFVTVATSAAGSTGVQKVCESQLSASSSSSSLADAQQIGSSSATSPPSTVVADRRVGRGMETSPEERNKIGQSLHDFKRNFVLESNGENSQVPVRQDDTAESTLMSSTPTTSSVPTTPVSSAPETSLQLQEQAADASVKPDKIEDIASTAKYKLNPNAKEFKPKTHPLQIEAQSPSPQPRSSPHMPQVVHYPHQQTVLLPYSYIMANQLANPQRKRATVSLGAGIMNDIAAHQVTGQPLLATQPPGMMYLQAAGQALPTAYQFYSPQMINSRMVGAPGTLTMAQASQIAGMEQAAAQNQPQPVFMTAQPHQIHAPIPAHLHPQPAHAQAISLPASSQQAQTVHVPNPVPSPVQHQQQNSQPMPQPLPHHISQGPPQSSATPQPAHYPQMTVNYPQGMPAVSRSSMSGQQNLAAGHSSVFISAPQFTYNGSTAQYTFAPQPQTSQNSSHGAGPQPQYVFMPQPSTQGHPSMQQHTGQPYTTSIPYQPQQHLMQGPPHMPPNHTANLNQSSPHLMHPGMSAGIHQQVSSAQPNMYMQMQSTLQPYQHQQ